MAGQCHGGHDVATVHTVGAVLLQTLSKPVALNTIGPHSVVYQSTGFSHTALPFSQFSAKRRAGKR